MTAKGPRRPERSFGLSVGTVLCIIGAALWWRGRPVRAEIVVAAGATLVMLGAAAPAVLRTPSAVWWRFSRVLGYYNARILLSIFFFAVLAPVGFVWRLAGRDPLRRRRSGASGWQTYPARYRDPHHFTRMF
jgi:hypothetical protein